MNMDSCWALKMTIEVIWRDCRRGKDFETSEGPRKKDGMISWHWRLISYLLWEDERWSTRLIWRVKKKKEGVERWKIGGMRNLLTSILDLQTVVVGLNADLSLKVVLVLLQVLVIDKNDLDPRTKVVADCNSSWGLEEDEEKRRGREKKREISKAHPEFSANFWNCW